MRSVWWIMATVLVAGCTTPAPASPPNSAGDGLVCLSPCPMVLDATDGLAYEPTIAVNPVDPRRMVIVTNEVSYPADNVRDRWFYIHRSTDGGASWSRVRLSGAGEDRTHPLYGMNALADPSLTYLPDGTVVLAALTFVDAVTQSAPARIDGAGRLFTALSDDDGHTFTDFELVRDSTGANGQIVTTGMLAAVAFDGNDKPWITAGPAGDLLLVWSRIEAPPQQDPTALGRESLVYARSQDGGRTWSPMSLIVDHGGPSGASPVVLADGTWLIAYYDRLSEKLLVARSTDDGSMWDVKEIGDTPFVPTLQAFEHRSDALMLLYPALSTEGGQVPTLVRSMDGGLTWGDALRLDVPSANFTLPSLAAFSATGSFVSWYGPSPDKAGELAFKTATTRSSVVETSLTLVDGIKTEPHRFGDYMGVVAVPQGAVVTWVANGSDARDLFAARVQFAGSS